MKEKHNMEISVEVEFTPEFEKRIEGIACNEISKDDIVKEKTFDNCENDMLNAMAYNTYSFFKNPEINDYIDLNNIKSCTSKR
jgi:hypothetical protein